MLWGLFAAAVIVQCVSLYSPSGPPQPTGAIPHLDKVGHFAIFAAVALTARWLGFAPWLIGVVLGVHAGLSEIIQAWFLADRTGDVTDLIADAIGIAVGIWLGRFPRSWAAARQGRSSSSLPKPN